jgi:riboflavin biosynthesis pyrimidine reductase
MDRLILGVIRQLSDVVVVGASSVRAEGYFVPRAAALAIVTASGDLTGHQITQRPDRGELLVLCTAGAVSRARETTDGLDVTIVVVDSASDVISGGAILAALRNHGYAGVVCEGGPTLAARLIADDLIDEFCLTTSAQLSPRALPLFTGAELPERQLELRHLAIDGASNVYARWAFPMRSSQSAMAVSQRS